MLDVPGARLYYRVRGSGPPLLVLQGGAGAAEGADAVVTRLAERYTVVTYDRRGLSRSPMEEPAASPGIATHADDASRLLAAVAAGPARVVGFSMGALLGLELVVRHPEQVSLLVAHEPPVPELLPDAARERAQAEQASVEETFRTEGVAGAMLRFMALTHADFTDVEPGVALARPAGDRAAQYGRDFAFFMAHDAPAVRLHRLDLPALERALRSGDTRVVPAAGETDRAAWIHHCARALAERLGVPLVELPGGHNGFITHPNAFAARLLAALD